MSKNWYETMIEKFNVLSKEIDSMKEVVIVKQQLYTTINYDCLSHSWIIYKNIAECSKCGQLIIQKFKIYP